MWDCLKEGSASNKNGHLGLLSGIAVEMPNAERRIPNEFRKPKAEAWERMTEL
jgi:hypothetical protein